jgi:hypothetical protein
MEVIIPFKYRLNKFYNIIFALNSLNIISGFIWISFLNTTGKIEVPGIYYRIFTIILSSLSILIGVANNRFYFLKNNKEIFFYYVTFVSFYFLRICFDSIFFNHHLAVFESDDVITFILMTASYMIIQPISLFSNSEKSISYIKNNSYLLFSAPFILNVIFNMGFNIVPSIERESTFVGIGINNLGFLVAIILNYSLIKLMTYNSIRVKILNFIVLVFSIYILGITGTKSGFVSTIIIMSIFFLLRIRKINFFYFFLNLCLFFFVGFLTFDVWWGWVELYFRLLEQLVDLGDENRYLIWSQAINLFLGSPIVGASFVIPKFGFFHNFILDAFVSIGFFGGIIFLVFSYNIIRICFYQLKYFANNSFVTIAFLTIFIAGMFSSNLFSNWLFWSFSMLLIIFYNVEKKI